MIRLTAGNDTPFIWAVKLQGQPFDLSGKDVKVYVINSRGEIPVASLNIEGNRVSGVFEGRYQTRLGMHSLALRVNEGRPEMKTATVANAFELVQWSADAGGSEAGDVIFAPVVITSELRIGTGGGGEGGGGGSYDDTAIWEALNDKVDKVDGKGLSDENFTTEEKQKLAGLENYDDTKLKEELAETYATKEYVNEAVSNAGGGGEGCECATPDWSAPEGEQGHILNRPCYFELSEMNIFETDVMAGSPYLTTMYGGDLFRFKVFGETFDIDLSGKEIPTYDYTHEIQNKLSYIFDIDTIRVSVDFYDAGDGALTMEFGYVANEGESAPDELTLYVAEYVVNGRQRLSEGLIPQTIARKSELTELSAEVGKLPTKEYVDNAVANAGGGGGTGSSDDTMTRIVAGATPYICYKKTDGTIGFWDGYFVGTNHRQQTDIVEILFGGLGATPNASQFLNGWTNLEKIYPYMNASGCTDLSFAFQNDAKLKDLSMLKDWDVSQVTNANSCFAGCAPEILPIDNWNIAKIADMSSMFKDYKGIDVDFSRWTNNVVTTLVGFMRGSSVKKADLHNISTEKCTTFEGAMRGCANLQWLDIRGWSCVSATSLHAMLNGCSQLTTLVGNTAVEVVIAQDIKVLDGYTATSNLSIKESSIPLNRASLRALINGLADMTETGATLPIGSANIAKLTSDDIAVATAKGWTIS